MTTSKIFSAFWIAYSVFWFVLAMLVALTIVGCTWPALFGPLGIIGAPILFRSELRTFRSA